MKKILYLMLISCCVCLSVTLTGCPPTGGGGGGGGSGPTYSVSGTIHAANNSAIDSDVNDVSTTPVSNDSFASAQSLPNPAILGGYVNRANAGEDGNSFSTGDVSDIYSVSLTENQTITLSIGDTAADLDLYLYDAADTDTPVRSSEGVESTESVITPASGNYFVEVFAYNNDSVFDASNYILLIGQPITAATVLDPRMQEDFMPGHVIVAFKDDPATAGSGLKKVSKATYQGMANKVMKQGAIRVYELTPENRAQVFKNLSLPPTESNRSLYQTREPDEQLKLDTLRVIDALNRDPNVRFAEPNYFRYPLFVPNDPEYSKQWHYPMINMPQAWEVTAGLDVIVAVIDTGILADHPDMQNQLASGLTGGYDFISLTSISNDGDGIDPDPEDAGDDMQGGSSFHGTHVSGTVAAETGNSQGVAGVAYEAKIMSLRALGVGGGLSSDIMQCMKYAARLTNDSGTLPPQKADVINMSLGGGSPSGAEQIIVDEVRAEGVIIVAAAGNESTSTLSYPASYDGVISVSAVGPDKTLSSYSNFGTEIDVAAPGGDFDAFGDCVYSTSGDDTGGSAIQNIYSFSCGTSMASPHMAGVVALMKAVEPTMTPADLDALIANGAITEDLQSDGATVRNNSFGYGLIDAFKAVDAVSGGLPAYLLADPVSLNFGNGNTQLTVTLSKSNSDALTVSGVTEDADWLTVTADSGVTTEGLGDYLVEVNRTGLADGPYYATITFNSDQNDVVVSVIMYQGVVSVPGDSGFHYVLLLDGTTFGTMYQANVPVSNGTYSYSFPAVSEGSYVVFAGTDSDNDFYIGDAGESSGAYISLDQPVFLTVDRNRNGIDFNTVFEQTVSADQLVAGDSAFTGYRRLE